jgi:histidinol dehydrogenase
MMMKVYVYPDPVDWEAILRRPTIDHSKLEDVVRPVLEAVRVDGDAALRAYTERFDGVKLDRLEVDADEIAAAERNLDEDLKNAILVARENIARFHRSQHEPTHVVETMPGVKCWRKSVGIERVGLYIPGGTAPLFSTVLMLGVPARLAGCREIILCTPPRRDGSAHPAILFAAKSVGVTRIFKVGGAQAIGAMAYGTPSIPRVYKILGPGNQYVTAAKQLIYRSGVAIDMPAGPSEVLVLADHSARPEYVAADLLSQAEHGADSQVVLVAFDEALVQAVQAEIRRQIKYLPRHELAAQALANSVAIVTRDLDEAVELVNAYAPEHLIIAMETPDEAAERIVNAGSVFLGHYTPESVGDYASGTNHTLPTNGLARAYSGVSLDTFLKKITFQRLTRVGLERIAPTVEQLAEAEELFAHKNAVRIRLES